MRVRARRSIASRNRRVVRVADQCLAAGLQTEGPVGAAGPGHLSEALNCLARDLTLTATGRRRYQLGQRERGRNGRLLPRSDGPMRSRERGLIPAETVVQHTQHPPGGYHAGSLATPLDLRGRRGDEPGGYVVVSLPRSQQ